MKTNATKEQIVKRLQEVFNSAELTAEYMQPEESWQIFCGWCGTQSPLTRAAFVKAFGLATVEEAEAEAKQLNAAAAGSYRGSEWPARFAEADEHATSPESVPTEGAFVWGVCSWMKQEGDGLCGEIEAQTWKSENDEKNENELLRVDKVVNVSAEDFEDPHFPDQLTQCGGFPGGGWIEDSEEMKDAAAAEGLRLSYTLVTLVTDGERYYYIDTEGYSYARYIILPLNWRTQFAELLAKEEANRAAKERAEQEREAAEYAEAVADYKKRCAKWAHLMQPVAPYAEAAKAAKWGSPEQKAAERKVHSISRANILAMCRAAFPGVKFSLTQQNGWGEDWTLTYTDGPTLEQFEDATDLDLFSTHCHTFDGMTDCADVDFYAEDFCNFAADYMEESKRGGIRIVREMSKETRAAFETKATKAVPELKATDAKEYPEVLKNSIQSKVEKMEGGEHLADELRSWQFPFINRLQLAEMIFRNTDFTKAEETPKAEPKAEAAEAQEAQPVEAQPVEAPKAEPKPRKQPKQKAAKLTAEAYSERATVVRGYSDKQYFELTEMGGRYNPRLKGGAGIIFSTAKHGEAIARYIATH